MCNSPKPSLTFNNSTFCPHSCIYVFCVDLRTNSHYFPTQHSPTVLRNPARQEVSLHSLSTSEPSASTQFHALAALSPAQKAVPTEQEAGLGPTAGLDVLRQEKILLPPTDNRTPAPPPHRIRSGNTNALSNCNRERHREKCTERLTEFLYCNSCARITLHDNS